MALQHPSKLVLPWKETDEIFYLFPGDVSGQPTKDFALDDAPVLEGPYTAVFGNIEEIEDIARELDLPFFYAVDSSILIIYLKQTDYSEEELGDIELSYS